MSCGHVRAFQPKERDRQWILKARRLLLTVKRRLVSRGPPLRKVLHCRVVAASLHDGRQWSVRSMPVFRRDAAGAGTARAIARATAAYIPYMKLRLSGDRATAIAGDWLSTTGVVPL